MTGYYTPSITDDPYSSRQNFTIRDLPKLEAGEKYIVTYTATPGENSNVSGASHVSNSATGSSGNDNHSDWNDIVISQEVIQKWGEYNSNTGKIKWTIILNKDKRDIGGYILKDTMTVNGQEITIPEGTVITMTGADGSTQTIKLPYTFLEGSNDTYTITYETDAPQGDPGQSWNVYNKAEMDGDDEHYEAGNTVTGTNQDYGFGKDSEGLDQNTTTDKVGTYKWVSRIGPVDKITHNRDTYGILEEKQRR